jgi:short-subunit dehydrogenase
MKKMRKFAERYGPWALVTGAASGLGAEFCHQLAAGSINCIMVDIQEEILINYGSALSNEYGIETRAISTDLANEKFLDDILPVIDGLDIGLLINNAGYGSIGNFLSTGLDEKLRTLNVNCRASLILTHHFSKLMNDRGRGGIILLSSISAFQGTPLLANYAGTKAYNLVFGEALWDELRHKNIDVLAVLPGSTNTPAFNSVNPSMDAVKGMPYMEPGQVVSESLNTLGRKPSLVTGKANRVIGFAMTRLLSRKRAVKIIGKNTRRLYPYASED